MGWVQTLIVALIQGLTEFLPVSSQAHLVLYSWFTDEIYQGLDFDIILHAGSLVAVVWYFRKEMLAMGRSWLASLAGSRSDGDSRLAWWIIIGTLPAVVFGFLLKDLAGKELRAVWVMASSLILFGLMLGWADWRGRRDRDEHQLGLKAVLVIGFAQVLALIPGTSRSGITITAALFMGLTREAASRFSFLLSIPVISGATVLGLWDLSSAEMSTPWELLAFGFVASALSTYACIHYFLAFIRRIGMQPFVFYRIVLGGLLLALVLL